VDHHLTAWILDYLTKRPQYGKIQGYESDRVSCSMGAPQGTILAPVLDIEIVKSYKYLGVHLNNKMDWPDDALYKKGQSTLSAEETEVFRSTGSTSEDLL